MRYAAREAKTKVQSIQYAFLDALSHFSLFIRRSIAPSVCLSVGWSVGMSVTPPRKSRDRRHRLPGRASHIRTQQFVATTLFWPLYPGISTPRPHQVPLTMCDPWMNCCQFLNKLSAPSSVSYQTTSEDSLLRDSPSR